MPEQLSSQHRNDLPQPPTIASKPAPESADHAPALSTSVLPLAHRTSEVVAMLTDRSKATEAVAIIKELPVEQRAEVLSSVRHLMTVFTTPRATLESLVPAIAGVGVEGIVGILGTLPSPDAPKLYHELHGRGNTPIPRLVATALADKELRAQVIDEISSHGNAMLRAQLSLALLAGFAREIIPNDDLSAHDRAFFGRILKDDQKVSDYLKISVADCAKQFLDYRGSGNSWSGNNLYPNDSVQQNVANLKRELSKGASTRTWLETFARWLPKW